MATYPPPPGFDPRQQERLYRAQLKAQRRAQKIALRAQLNAYRLQARANRRSSIVGPLLVVTLGVLFLLIQFGRVPAYRVEQWFGQWWPVVLVIAGLVLVVEWAFDTRSYAEGQPPRRGVGAGVIFLLILVALTGASIQGFHDFRESILNNLHIGPDNIDEVFRDKHESQQIFDQPFPAGTALNVQSPRGNVTITGDATDNKVHVVLNKQVYSWSEDEAARLDKQLIPTFELSGSTLNIALPTIGSAHGDLTISVPAAAQASVNTTFGDIAVADLNAPVSVTANHGDVSIDHITGTVDAHTNNSSSSFSAHTIHGDLMLHGHADDLNLTDISGQVAIEGEFFGDTHLEHLTGPFSFRTSRTQFSVASLLGVVDIGNHADMTGSQLVGPIELHTRSRNISFERTSGPIDISNSHGSVDLSSSAPVGNITIDNSNGEVNLTVPLPAKGKPGFSLEARNKDGGIDDELDGSSVESSPSAVHTATYGIPASHISLSTTHDDITIHNSSVEPPSPPNPPAPPPPPPTPAHPHTKST